MTIEPPPRQASAAHRASLQLVAEPDSPPAQADWLTADSPDHDRRAQRVLDRWAPEHQLVGALMWLAVERARPIVELVPAKTIWRPQARWAYEVIAGLVDAGQAPTPVAVLQRARTQPAAADLPITGTCTPLQLAELAGRPRYRQLALYLFDAYSQTMCPAAADTYAREVLDDAYRRAVGAAGVRMQQLAETCFDRAELTEQFTAIRDELAELWRRAEAASKPGWWRP